MQKTAAGTWEDNGKPVVSPLIPKTCYALRKEHVVSMRSPYIVALRDAACVVILAAGLALGFNKVRSQGLPLVAERAYEVLVPCPDTVAEAPGIEPKAVGLQGDLVVDARSKVECEAWHVPGAQCVPFDYLDPTPAEKVREIARSGARRVVVYGDGQEPDSGHELARELAGRGIRNVVWVRGGAPALREALSKGGH